MFPPNPHLSSVIQVVPGRQGLLKMHQFPPKANLMDFGGPKENIDENISAQGDKGNRPGGRSPGFPYQALGPKLPHGHRVSTVGLPVGPHKRDLGSGLIGHQSSTRQSHDEQQK
jgi:hypothetical protein